MKTKTTSRENRVQGSIAQMLVMLVITLMTLASTVSARPKTGQDARQVVRGWLKQGDRPLGTPLNRDVVGIETCTDGDGIALYHVASLRSGGFVVTSADDEIEPIVAFADNGNFVFSDDNPLFALVLQDMQTRMREIKSHSKQTLYKTTSASTPLLTESQQKWARFGRTSEGYSLLSSTVSANGVAPDDVRVWPLLDTNWNQETAGGDACFNYYTPQYRGGEIVFSDGDADNYPSGCVATAIAQVLRYHQYPDQAPQSGSYAIRVTPAGWDTCLETEVTLLGGDGQGGPYQWDLMTTDVTNAMTPVQRQAIGALCADVGAAVYMNYGPNGSGAGWHAIAPALLETFHYAQAITGVREIGPYVFELTPNIQPMIHPNLDAGYPVILCILALAEKGGHAVVADGYGYNFSAPYYHLNLGWSGNCDAWYNLPQVLIFDFVASCTYNIFPEQEGEIVSGRVLDKEGRPLGDAVLTLSGAGIERSVSTNANGVYAFAGLPSALTYEISIQAFGATFSPAIRTVTTHTSVSGQTRCGNVWGVDFKAK